MTFLRAASVLALLFTAFPAVSLAQAPPAAPATAGTLRIDGDVDTPLTLGLADLKGFPRTRVETKDNDRTIRYDGVLLGELLARADAPIGPELRGEALATYVIASATDGYQVVFSLAELDPAFTSNDIIVADTVDGQPLAEHQGPFRIVAPRDARPARSVRMLTRLQVVRLGK